MVNVVIELALGQALAQAYAEPGQVRISTVTREGKGTLNLIIEG